MALFPLELIEEMPDSAGETRPRLSPKPGVVGALPPIPPVPGAK